MPPETNDVSSLLIRIGPGNSALEKELFERVNAELRRLAKGILHRSQSDPLLQPTALVNEAYLKLVGSRSIAWQGKAHFFHVAARAMRQVLVDYARTRLSDKREGNRIKVDLSESLAIPETDPDLLLAIDRALEGLREIDERCARIVDLRCFGGLTVEETADLLKVSLRTVKRDWDFARGWLEGQLESSK